MNRNFNIWWMYLCIYHFNNRIYIFSLRYCPRERADPRGLRLVARHRALLERRPRGRRTPGLGGDHLLDQPHRPSGRREAHRRRRPDVRDVPRAGDARGAVPGGDRGDVEGGDSVRQLAVSC